MEITDARKLRCSFCVPPGLAGFRVATSNNGKSTVGCWCCVTQRGRGRDGSMISSCRARHLSRGAMRDSHGCRGPSRQTRVGRATIGIVFMSLACAVAWQAWQTAWQGRRATGGSTSPGRRSANHGHDWPGGEGTNRFGLKECTRNYLVTHVRTCSHQNMCH